MGEARGAGAEREGSPVWGLGWGWYSENAAEHFTNESWAPDMWGAGRGDGRLPHTACQQELLARAAGQRRGSGEGGRVQWGILWAARGKLEVQMGNNRASDGSRTGQ